MSQQARECTHSHLQCRYCGSPVDLENYNQKLPLPQVMKKEQLCFACAFWKNLIDNPVPYRQIINGTHWTFNPWSDKPMMFAGHGGRAFYIMLNDGNVLRSNNAWFQGEIPEHFRSQLPDTAKFISRTAYYKIKDQPMFQCQSKGCWDRYHCYWYDKTVEVDGAWNKIPSNHKIGDECCELFLDKNIVYE
jgi:hypothetical protein